MLPPFAHDEENIRPPFFEFRNKRRSFPRVLRSSGPSPALAKSDPSNPHANLPGEGIAGAGLSRSLARPPSKRGEPPFDVDGGLSAIMRPLSVKDSAFSRLLKQKKRTYLLRCRSDAKSLRAQRGDTTTMRTPGCGPPEPRGGQLCHDGEPHMPRPAHRHQVYTSKFTRAHSSPRPGT
jgi:hypothetical protein